MNCTCPTCGQDVNTDAIMFDPGAGIVIGNGIVISLPRREATILEYLWARPGRMITKSALFEAVYDVLDEPDCGEAVVESHMSKMRKKVKDAGIVIRSERFKGYQLLTGGSHG